MIIFGRNIQCGVPCFARKACYEDFLQILGKTALFFQLYILISIFFFLLGACGSSCSALAFLLLFIYYLVRKFVYIINFYYNSSFRFLSYKPGSNCVILATVCSSETNFENPLKIRLKNCFLDGLTWPSPTMSVKTRTNRRAEPTLLS